MSFAGYTVDGAGVHVAASKVVVETFLVRAQWAGLRECVGGRGLIALVWAGLKRR